MPPVSPDPQSLAVKRAQVEFHNFASLGEPEQAMGVYAFVNVERRAILQRHGAFIGGFAPFLEIGANAGHTSYMLVNEFGGEGFALDISADALRHGIALMDRWKLTRAPIRLAGDALRLPFRDGSLRCVMTFQTLSQFLKLDDVFAEVKRVLAPGGVFLFAEEPLRRLLTLRLYRCPYKNLMRPWERKFYDWGLLGYLVRDVIGAHQEESFGIRQNHTMYLADWTKLVSRYFDEVRYEPFVAETGWGEWVVKKLAIRLDPHRSPWHAARWLGGTLAALCKKSGATGPLPSMQRFEDLLQCPDCGGSIGRDESDVLRCASCGYAAANEGGVYNMLRSADRAELYPGDRDDDLDFCSPRHEARLIGDWYELEGEFGNKYRWIGADVAKVKLQRVRQGPQKLRIRGHAHPNSFGHGVPVKVEVSINGAPAGVMELERAGLFIFEASVPEADEYTIGVSSTPTWEAPPDDRLFSVSLSRVRLVPRE
jgi:ubiquinone/menaquinone biosynthesis C-methylase UbiE